MGHAARANRRSPEGGKPQPYTALYRLWRMVQQFHDDRLGFERYLSDKPLTAPERAALEHLWTEQHPAPRVTLT